MSDIVERLRGWAYQAAPISSTTMDALTQEAAAEIERLRAAENEAIKHLVEMDNKVFDAAAEIERLRAQILKIEGHYVEVRNDALEEAARVAEEWPPRRWMTTKQLAAAIRALKGEPASALETMEENERLSELDEVYGPEAGKSRGKEPHKEPLRSSNAARPARKGDFSEFYLYEDGTDD